MQDVSMDLLHRKLEQIRPSEECWARQRKKIYQILNDWKLTRKLQNSFIWNKFLGLFFFRFADKFHGISKIGNHFDRFFDFTDFNRRSDLPYESTSDWSDDFLWVLKYELHNIQRHLKQCAWMIKQLIHLNRLFFWKNKLNVFPVLLVYTCVALNSGNTERFHTLVECDVSLLLSNEMVF